jgi:hypothetical protein
MSTIRGRWKLCLHCGVHFSRPEYTRHRNNLIDAGPLLFCVSCRLPFPGVQAREAHYRWAHSTITPEVTCAEDLPALTVLGWESKTTRPRRTRSRRPCSRKTVKRRVVKCPQMTTISLPAEILAQSVRRAALLPQAESQPEQLAPDELVLRGLVNTSPSTDDTRRRISSEPGDQLLDLQWADDLQELELAAPSVPIMPDLLVREMGDWLTSW